MNRYTVLFIAQIDEQFQSQEYSDIIIFDDMKDEIILKKTLERLEPSTLRAMKDIQTFNE